VCILQSEDFSDERNAESCAIVTYTYVSFSVGCIER
jgi:hypothetical protein